MRTPLVAKRFQCSVSCATRRLSEPVPHARGAWRPARSFCRLTHERVPACCPCRIVVVRFFIDENLSPSLVRICNDAGFDATCSRDRRRLGDEDPSVAELCFEEERVCVTVNAGDFRQLAEHNGLHAGLVTMPSARGERQRELMAAAITAVLDLAAAAGEEPAAFMINRVLEVEADGTWAVYDLPASE